MSETKHTPGHSDPLPWCWSDTLDEVRTGDGKLIALVADGDGVVWHAKLDNLNARADARLIAAAPDLLAACESALIELGECHGGHEEIEQLRSAIAKAKP